MRAQHSLEIVRRHEAAMNDPLPQAGDVAAFVEKGQHRVGKAFADRVPVDIAVVVGHRDQRVRRVVPRRCEAGVGDRRDVEILREIVGEDLTLEDVGQELLVARAEDDVVVPQVGIAVLHPIAEIDHHQRHALLAELDQRVAIDPPVCLVDELQIGGRIVGVRHDQIGRQRFAVRQRHAGRDALAAALLDLDPVDFRIQPHRPAELLELADHRLDQRAGAADREMHAPGLFDEMDHRIDCRDLQRVAADQQRFEAEHLPHLVALEIFRDQREQRLDRAELEQVGEDADHRAERPEIGVA